ncbi:hypothetical protein [Bdellovibrio sp. HCB274]
MELDPKSEPESKQIYVLVGTITAILLGFLALAILIYLYWVLP